MISLHVDIHRLVDFYEYIVHTAVSLYMFIFASTLNNEEGKKEKKKDKEKKSYQPLVM